MVGDFFNYVFSKGPYAPMTNNSIANSAISSIITQEVESLVQNSPEPKFSYINEMKTAQNEKEENVNRFLTTPGFLETLDFYRPDEHPELPGYASTIDGSFYNFFEDLNSILLNKKQGEELVNLLFPHFEGKTDTPDSYFDMMEYYRFTPESADTYKYYGDTKNLNGIRASVEKGNSAVFQLKEDLGPRLQSFDMQTNENGYVTEMSVGIDNCFYSVSYEYFEDSGYPLSKTSTKTVNGNTTTSLTCYNYGQGGEHLEDTDFNDDGVLDTVINYNEACDVISYQNVRVADIYTVDQEALGVRDTAIYGHFGIDSLFSETVSRTVDGKYFLHYTNQEGEKAQIEMNKEGYISCADFYNYMVTNKKDDPFISKIDPSENTMYRYNNKMQIEKIYLEDNSVVIYDYNGNLVKGFDKSAFNANGPTDIDENIEDFKQGTTAGDCWLLASIDALSATKTGAKIIKKAISEPLFSSDEYCVKLGGKKYPVTIEELKMAKNNTNYSRGDDDVLLFELAFEKYLGDVLAGKMENPHVDMDSLANRENILDGGNLETVMYALGKEDSFSLGADYFDYYNEHYQSNQYDYLMEEFENNPNEYVAIATFTPKDTPLLYAYDVSGNQVLLANTYSHGWSIQKVENGLVTLSNPWNTEEKTVTMTTQELKRVADGISFGYIK